MLISDDPQPVMDRQTDNIEGKNYVGLNRSPDVQEAKPDAHEVHDIQKVHKITGTNNTEPVRSLDKFETTDVDIQEAEPDTHDVHDVHNVNIIRGKLKVYQYADEKVSK